MLTIYFLSTLQTSSNQIFSYSTRNSHFTSEKIKTVKMSSTLSKIIMKSRLNPEGTKDLFHHCILLPHSHYCFVNTTICFYKGTHPSWGVTTHDKGCSRSVKVGGSHADVWGVTAPSRLDPTRDRAELCVWKKKKIKRL